MNSCWESIVIVQSWEKNVDCFTPGEGLMPASFKVRQIPSEDDPSVWDEHLDPDFGESAIGRVAPVDSGTAQTTRTGSWKILEDLGGSWRILEDLGRSWKGRS